MYPIFRPATAGPSVAAGAAAGAAAGGAPEVPFAMRPLPTVYTAVRGGETFTYPLGHFNPDTTIVFRPTSDNNKLSQDVAALLKSTGIITATNLHDATDIVMECRSRPFNFANNGRNWKEIEKSLADKEKAWVEKFDGILVPKEDVLGYAKLLLERSLILKATGGWKKPNPATKARISAVAFQAREKSGAKLVSKKKKTKAQKSMKPK
jgi:hypothetical protein